MNNCFMTPKPDLALDDIADARTDRAGKLFLVLRGGLRRCLICDNVFTNRDAAKHSQVPCRPAHLGGSKLDAVHS
jgi:hypothetical protein